MVRGMRAAQVFGPLVVKYIVATPTVNSQTATVAFVQQ